MLAEPCVDENTRCTCSVPPSTEDLDCSAPSSTEASDCSVPSRQNHYVRRFKRTAYSLQHDGSAYNKAPAALLGIQSAFLGWMPDKGLSGDAARRSRLTP